MRRWWYNKFTTQGAINHFEEYRGQPLVPLVHFYHVLSPCRAPWRTLYHVLSTKETFKRAYEWNSFPNMEGHPARGHRGLESILADIEWEAGYASGRLPVYHKAWWECVCQNSKIGHRCDGAQWKVRGSPRTLLYFPIMINMNVRTKFFALLPLLAVAMSVSV